MQIERTRGVIILHHCSTVDELELVDWYGRALRQLLPQLTERGIGGWERYFNPEQATTGVISWTSASGCEEHTDLSLPHFILSTILCFD